MSLNPYKLMYPVLGNECSAQVVFVFFLQEGSPEFREPESFKIGNNPFEFHQRRTCYLSFQRCYLSFVPGWYHFDLPRPFTAQTSSWGQWVIEAVNASGLQDVQNRERPMKNCHPKEWFRSTQNLVSLWSSEELKSISLLNKGADILHLHITQPLAMGHLDRKP